MAFARRLRTCLAAGVCASKPTPATDAPQLLFGHRTFVAQQAPLAIAIVVFDEDVDLDAEQRGEAPEPEPRHADGHCSETAVEERVPPELGSVVAEARGSDRAQHHGDRGARYDVAL